MVTLYLHADYAYQVPRDELLVLADGERHLARRVDGHVDDSGLEVENFELQFRFLMQLGSYRSDNIQGYCEFVTQLRNCKSIRFSSRKALM